MRNMVKRVFMRDSANFGTPLHLWVRGRGGDVSRGGNRNRMKGVKGVFVKGVKGVKGVRRTSHSCHLWVGGEGCQ